MAASVLGAYCQEQIYMTCSTYIQKHSIDPSSVQNSMNMKLVTKKNGKERKERRGR
jgi:hypothetical protein